MFCDAGGTNHFCKVFYSLSCGEVFETCAVRVMFIWVATVLAEPMCFMESVLCMLSASRDIMQTRSVIDVYVIHTCVVNSIYIYI